MPSTVGRGQYYENRAARFLRKRGFTIRHRNFRARRGEIDIVAEKERELVFVEVRYRKGARFGYAFETVDLRKQIRLVHAARSYLNYQKPVFEAARFDIIAFTGKNAAPSHLRDAFRVENVPGLKAVPLL